MKRHWFLVCDSLLILGAPCARAQTGWARTLAESTQSLPSNEPEIHRPQAGFAKVGDLKASDGTTSVPRCDDAAVISAVKDGVVEILDREAGKITGRETGFIKKVKLGDVWVHPTYSNSNVCRMTIQTDIPFTYSEPYEFQSYAQDGERRVFFMKSR